MGMTIIFKVFKILKVYITTKINLRVCIMFIVSAQFCQSIKFIDEDMNLTISKDNAFRYNSEDLALTAKKYCESRWGLTAKVLSV
jgi:hypothetical protein